MAITAQGMDRATWNLVYETGRPDRQLPWAWMNFGDAGEEGTRYVVPLPLNMSMITDMPDVAFPSSIRRLSGVVGERFYAPNSPFPCESGRPARCNNREDVNKDGPIGVHFFGGV